MRSIIGFAAIAIVAGMIVPRFATQMNEARPVPRQPSVQPTTPRETSSNPRSTAVRPDSNGHFWVEGRIDGLRLEFLVDTGASVIALKPRDAAMIGIHPAQRDFTALVKTANGITRAAPVQLEMVEINDLMVRNVAAMIMPDGALSDNLLGMSFLTRLHHFEYVDGQLSMEQ